MVVQLGRRYILEDFQLEPDNHLLVRAGASVPLSKKRFQVLLYLVEQRGRLVTREELLERFWDGSEAYEEVLTKCVSEIRKALGDQKKPHRFVETVPAVGYRYVGPAEEVTQPEGTVVAVEKTRAVRVVIEEDDGTPCDEHPAARAEPDYDQRPQPALPAGRPFARPVAVALAVGLVAVVTAGVVLYLRSGNVGRPPRSLSSIAVMPLKNLSGDPGNEYFSDGMSETLTDSLSKVDGLRVISSSSVFHLKGLGLDPREIGRQLNVASVLEGSVRKDQTSIRVSVRLVSTEDGSVLWASETKDQSLQDVFNIQDEIARNVVASLRLKLSQTSERRLTKRHTENAEAYQLYLRGSYHFDRWRGPDLQQAIEYYRQATALDPHYALAYARLADCYSLMSGFGMAPPTESMPKAREAALRALELDDQLAEAHTSLGIVKDLYDWDFAGAERELKRAVELNPNSATAHYHYGHYLPDVGGQFDEAIQQVKMAEELDPLSVAVSQSLTELFYYSRQYDRAIEQAHKTLELEPNSSPAYLFVGWSYKAKGARDREMEAVFARLSITATPEALADFRKVYAARGWDGFWRSQLDYGKERWEKGYFEPYYLALASLRLGDKEQALGWLEKALEVRSGWVPTFAYDPALDALRPDPRFTNLLARAGRSR